MTGFKLWLGNVTCLFLFNGFIFLFFGRLIETHKALNLLKNKNKQNILPKFYTAYSQITIFFSRETSFQTFLFAYIFKNLSGRKDG